MVAALVEFRSVTYEIDGSGILRDLSVEEGETVVLTGLRIATVTTIGTATIAAAIGGGGLADTKTILAGAVPAALMAIAADEVLGWIERRFSY